MAFAVLMFQMCLHKDRIIDFFDYDNGDHDDDDDDDCYDNGSDGGDPQVAVKDASHCIYIKFT